MTLPPEIALQPAAPPAPSRAPPPGFAPDADGHAETSAAADSPIPTTARDDPHAPKLSPDDPRLQLRRPASRTLRTGPLVVLAAGLFGATVLAVLSAFQPPSKVVTPHPDPSGAPAPPVVPDTIRNASAGPVATSHPRPDAGPRHGVAAERAPQPADARLRVEQERDLQARGASILFETPAGPRDDDHATEASRPSTSVPGAVTPSMGQGPPAGGDSDPNLQDRKNAFLAGQRAVIANAVAATIQHPESPYELQAGTILPTVLVTGINSDLPGPVIGQIRENVYDTVSGNFLLVPQGSRLLAQYDSMVAWGQERVLLCWNRLLFPNGDSIALPCMPAADLAGAAGVTDQVDDHWVRILKGAAVATLLSGTTQALAGNTTGFNPTVAQTWAGNAAGTMNQVGQQLTRRDLTVQPTITVRPGFAVNVIVTKDLVLTPYPDPSVAPGDRP